MDDAPSTSLRFGNHFQRHPKETLIDISYPMEVELILDLIRELNSSDRASLRAGLLNTGFLERGDDDGTGESLVAPPRPPRHSII